MDQQLETFLSVIHRYTPDDSSIALNILRPDRMMTTEWFLKRHLDKMIERIRRKPHRNTYVRITPCALPPAHGRGLESDSEGSSVLWFDYDCYGDQLRGRERLLALDQKPSLIIDSGFGLQAYWQLDRFYTEKDLIKGANKALLKKLDKDAADSCFDLARVLRAPETYNMKQPESPMQVAIVHYDPNLVYTLDQFAQASLDDVTIINAWDIEALPETFLDDVKEADAKLYKRIISEESAKKAEAATKADGTVDRSRNDAYIVMRLLALGFSIGKVLAVLTHQTWFSGAKYRATGRYDYVVTTVNNVARSYASSPDRFFVKGKFRPQLLGESIGSEQPFISVKGTLYRYTNGSFVPDAEEWVDKLLIEKLGKRWSSNAANEVKEWLHRKYKTGLDQINKHDGLVNVRNGMVDMYTGELHPHDAGYFSINQIPFDYVPDADTAALDAFIADILPEDTIPVFWEYVGSALDVTKFHPKAYMAFIGAKDSGKSLLLRWIRYFFGGDANVATVSFQDLTDNRFATSELLGKMINIFSDLSAEEAQSASKMKALTGDDVVRFESKFQKGHGVHVTTRSFFSANQHIAVKAPDEAFFERSLIIRCKNKFVPQPSKPHERLLNPRMTVIVSSPEYAIAGLVRAMQGLRRVVAQSGFTRSESIINAQNEFRFTADTVNGFLSAAMYMPGYVIGKQEMYQKYALTCQLANRRPIAEDRFFARVAESAERYGIDESYMVHKGVRQYCYIGRKPVLSFLPQSLVNEARDRIASAKGGNNERSR